MEVGRRGIHGPEVFPRLEPQALLAVTFCE